MHKILIVEDEDIIRQSLSKLLQRHGYQVSDAVSVKYACEHFNLKDFSLIISDMRLPGAAGTELIDLAKPVPVLIMTSYASLKSAVETMQRGAVDYISKPFSHDELVKTVARLLEKTSAPPVEQTSITQSLTGNSQALEQLRALVGRAAQSKLPILIEGESGSGRTTVAQQIAEHSPGDTTLQTINGLSATPEKLRDILNQCRRDDLLVVDYLDELASDCQALLIEALDQQSVRVAAICESNPDQLCDNGTLRRELLNRLKMLHLRVPALRERCEDIPQLAADFIRQQQPGHPGLSEEAAAALTGHSWPGNLADLFNCLRRALLMAPDHQLGISHLKLPNQQASSVPTISADLSLEEYFTQFVQTNQGHLTETQLAEKLGISRKSLWERRQKLGLSRPKKG